MTTTVSPPSGCDRAPGTDATDLHQAPGGLAEDVLENSAERYVRFFLPADSRRGVPADLTRVIGESCRGKTSLGYAFADLLIAHAKAF